MYFGGRSVWRVMASSKFSREKKVGGTKDTEGRLGEFITYGSGSGDGCGVPALISKWKVPHVYKPAFGHLNSFH